MIPDLYVSLDKSDWREPGNPCLQAQVKWTNAHSPASEPTNTGAKQMFIVRGHWGLWLLVERAFLWQRVTDTPHAEFTQENTEKRQSAMERHLLGSQSVSPSSQMTPSWAPAWSLSQENECIDKFPYSSMSSATWDSLSPVEAANIKTGKGWTSGFVGETQCEMRLATQAGARRRWVWMLSWHHQDAWGINECQLNEWEVLGLMDIAWPSSKEGRPPSEKKITGSVGENAICYCRFYWPLAGFTFFE